uniref:phage integrase N-terminal SAM-like domain-containing protein n=1 Tax=Methylibium sp. TaxID=2067992 RepID=UPI00286CDC09
MSPLRQRMLDALVLRGMAERTQEAYIDAVARLARHYRRSPDSLTAGEVQRYLLHLLRERHLSRS